MGGSHALKITFEFAYFCKKFNDSKKISIFQNKNEIAKCMDCRVRNDFVVMSENSQKMLESYKWTLKNMYQVGDK